MKKKVVIIGIDGATFDMILPMIEKGELTNFKKIMNEGVWSEMMSAYPPHTVPAWPCCYTGVNPGKLGLFDFREDSHLSYDEGRTLFSSDIKTTPLWRILSDRGKKVMVTAMPLTYPPQQVNGVMVAPVRMIEPDRFRTHPPELSEEIAKEIDMESVLKARKKYMEMHTSRRGSDLETFFESTIISSKLIIEKLTDISLYLLGRNEFDFSMFMLPIDAIQHHFWCFTDKNHPSYDKGLAQKYGKVIYDSYRQVDSALEKIIGRIDDRETTFILLSDHGFGPLYKTFNANRWLIEKGYLTLRKGLKSSFKMKYATVDRMLNKLGAGFATSVLPEFIKSMSVPRIGREFKKISEIIDWANSVAYATSYAININLKGREPEGIVEPGREYNELVNKLKSELYLLRDNETGEQPIEKIVHRSEIYQGKYVDSAPDIILLFKDPTYSLRKDCFTSEIFRQLTPDDRLTGHHTSFPKGICIMKGPDITRGASMKDIGITDIAPTVMYLLGESVPAEMDGRVLMEAISQDFKKSNQLIFSNEKGDSGTNNSPSPEKLSDQDKKAMEERLRQLGYMG